MEKIKTALLFGGVSSEHEVSCMSVASVADNIDRDKYEIYLMGITKDGKWFLYDGEIGKVRDCTWQDDTEHLHRAFICPDRSVHGIEVCEDGEWKEIRIDVVFPVMHGKNGEDGTMQGLLEIAGIPYVGCRTMASADCMDKDVCHSILSGAGIRQVKWLTYLSGCDYSSAKNEIEAKLGYPVFVKPANAGSSVGITKVHDEGELYAALDLAFENDKKIVVEEAVNKPIEIECSVIGNDDLLVGGPGEIVPADEFYSYDAKYYNAQSRLYIPARLPEETAEEVRETAKKAYRVLGCSGMSRVDFLIDGDTGRVYLNEPNTLPGFTDISMYPKLLMASGMTYPEIIDRLLELALDF